MVTIASSVNQGRKDGRKRIRTREVSHVEHPEENTCAKPTLSSTDGTTVKHLGACGGHRQHRPKEGKKLCTEEPSTGEANTETLIDIAIGTESTSHMQSDKSHVSRHGDSKENPAAEKPASAQKGKKVLAGKTKVSGPRNFKARNLPVSSAGLPDAQKDSEGVPTKNKTSPQPKKTFTPKTEEEKLIYDPLIREVATEEGGSGNNAEFNGASTKGAAKLSKKDSKKCKPESSASVQKSVLDYLMLQNRPYNAQLVFDNLQRAYKKTDVEHSLEELVTGGSAVVKDVGKMKVYLVAQSLFGKIMTEEEHAQADKEIDAEMKALRAATTQHGNALATIAKRDALRKEIRETEAKLNQMKKCSSPGVQILPEQLEAYRNFHGRLHAEWARRKKVCMNLIATISEPLGKTVHEVVRDLGVEVDEDHIPDDAYAAYSC